MLILVVVLEQRGFLMRRPANIYISLIAWTILVNLDRQSTTLLHPWK